MGNLYLLIFENKYHEASSLIGISPFYSPPELVNESGLPPSTTKPGMEGPLTAQTGQITPRLVLLVVFTDVAGGPYLSSSPLSLHLSSPTSIPAAPPLFLRRRLPPSLRHGAPPLPARASLSPSAPPRRRCQPVRR